MKLFPRTNSREKNRIVTIANNTKLEQGKNKLLKIRMKSKLTLEIHGKMERKKIFYVKSDANE